MLRDRHSLLVDHDLSFAEWKRWKLTRSFFPANRESCGKPYLLLMQSVHCMPKENVWHRGGQQEPTPPHPPQILWSSSGVAQQRREAKLGGEALRKEVFHPHGVSGQVQENRRGNALENSRTSHPKYLDRPHSPNPKDNCLKAWAGGKRRRRRGTQTQVSLEPTRKGVRVQSQG